MIVIHAVFEFLYDSQLLWRLEPSLLVLGANAPSLPRTKHTSLHGVAGHLPVQNWTKAVCVFSLNAQTKIGTGANGL